MLDVFGFEESVKARMPPPPPASSVRACRCRERGGGVTYPDGALAGRL